MKSFIIGIILLFLSAVSGMAAEDSGQMWLIKFQPGHSIIEQLHPDSLAKLDIIMRDIPDSSVIWFYGAANEMLWRGHNEHVSQALDGGKRIDRALELSQRYPYRNINISATHENVTGVKAVWYQETTIISNDTIYNIDNTYHYHINKETKLRIPVGLSVWALGDDAFVNPFIGVLVEKGDWLIGGKAGGIPFTFENDKSNSFIAGHVEKRLQGNFGVNGEIFMAWEYLTAFDTWTKKSVGLSGGMTATKNRLAVNLNLLVANEIRHDQDNSKWVGGFAATVLYFVK